MSYFCKPSKCGMHMDGAAAQVASHYLVIGRITIAGCVIDQSVFSNEPGASLCIFSLVPRPDPVFQCCTLKNGRAWYAKSRDNLCQAAAWF